MFLKENIAMNKYNGFKRYEVLTWETENHEDFGVSESYSTYYDLEMARSVAKELYENGGYNGVMIWDLKTTQSVWYNNVFLSERVDKDEQQ